jgi:molecular chaperone Hsp33
VSTGNEELRQETGFDRVLGFTLPGYDARGRIVRLGPVLDEVLCAHEYPAPVRHLLSEALVLTALMGSLLKEQDSQITFQAQARDGAVDLLVCDFRKGELRGYVSYDADKLSGMGTNPPLVALFGEACLAITFDLAATDERYQGIVPLEGDTLSEACEAYFARSEQVPTLLRLGIRADGKRSIASGLIFQHFPEGEEGKSRLDAGPDHPEWEHVSVLAGSIRHDELVDPDLSLEQLVWRLFNQEAEIRVERMASLSRGCRCTLERFEEILMRFPEDERVDMRDADGRIPVDCAFCSKLFRVSA